MRQSCLLHLRLGLHGDLVGADLFHLLLGNETFAGKGELTLGLNPGQFHFVLLVSLVLEEVQDLWQARDQ